MMFEEPLKNYSPKENTEEIKDLKDFVPADFLTEIENSETKIADKELSSKVKEIEDEHIEERNNNNSNNSDNNSSGINSSEESSKEQAASIKKVTPITEASTLDKTAKKAVEFMSESEKISLSTLYANLLTGGVDMLAEITQLKSRVTPESKETLVTAFNDYYKHKEVPVDSSKGALVIAVIAALAPVLYEAGIKTFNYIKTSTKTPPPTPPPARKQKPKQPTKKTSPEPAPEKNEVVEEKIEEVKEEKVEETTKKKPAVRKKRTVTKKKEVKPASITKGKKI